MPSIYTYTAAPFRPVIPDPTDLAGEDVRVDRGQIPLVPTGAWATTVGEQAALQSVVREFEPSPGSMPRRPEWGMGLGAVLFRGMNRADRDEAVARIRRRMQVNPRVTQIVQIKATALSSDDGLTVDLRFTSGNRGISTTAVIAPGGAAWR